MAAKKPIEIGQTKPFVSKSYSGRGKIIEIKPTRRGSYYTLQTKDHPRGVVSVRESQLVKAV